MINSAAQTIVSGDRRMPWNKLWWCRLRVAKRFFVDHCRLLIEGRENPRSGDVMDMVVCDTRPVRHSLQAGMDTSSDVPVWGS